ncbi:MAG: hypothetical protein KAZ30_02340 [Candidatus Magasanikbacteria bacterium]|nr:hypothetical protein [Candidatus Magasanikbacteria bacterium]
MDDTSKKNKYAALGVGAIILLLIVIYTFTNKSTNNAVVTIDDRPTENTTSTIIVTASSTVTTTTPVINKKPATTVTKPKIAGSATAYQKAIEEYQYRFQFSNCKGNPGKLTFKQGVKVMLDNRDEATHTFGFGGAKYTVKGYSFVIVTAPKAGTHNITCDGGGAAQMTTQK